MTTELADELAALHNAARGCVFDLAPRDGPIARLALFMHENGNRVIAALTGAGYAAGIEDAAKVADTFAQFKRETPDSRDVHLLTATDIAHSIRSLPQPAPAEDALLTRYKSALETIAFDKQHLGGWGRSIARQALTGTKGDGG